MTPVQGKVPTRLAISNGLGGASRWVLSSNFEAVLKAANARP